MGLSGINDSFWAVSGVNGVVPFAVEVVPDDIDAPHLLVGYRDSLRVCVAVEFAAHGQPGPGRGGADQVHSDNQDGCERQSGWLMPGSAEWRA